MWVKQCLPPIFLGMVYLYHLYIKMVIFLGDGLLFHITVYCLSTFSVDFPCFGIDNVGVNHVQNVEVVVGSNQETTISLEFIGYEMRM